jgi:hypothetical protein
VSRAIRPVRHAAGGVLRAAVLTVVLAGCALPASFGEPGGGATTADRASRPPVAVPAAREVERLVGLTREAVLAMLGPSTFTRRDGPAEIWRYATDDCFLTLFLHRGNQPAGSSLTVQHVDANPRSRAAASWVNARTCYGQVLESRGIPLAQS